MASDELANVDGPRMVSTCLTVSAEEKDLAASATGGQPEKVVGICKFFQQSRCRFGNRCHLSHSVSPSAAGDLQEGQSGKKTGRRKAPKKSDSSPKNVEKDEPSKKPRMRPANEVVSRILWDPSLNQEQFGVGYLDRFLGVLERPFLEFSWDRDVCSCDYSEELALPQHRIKYFTYMGKKIWDRESRMDSVFGSTGDPLQPPFAAGDSGEEASAASESTEDHLDTEAQDSGESPHHTVEEMRDTSSHVLPRSSSDVNPSCAETAQNEMTPCPQEMQDGCLSDIRAGNHGGGPADSPRRQGREAEGGMQRNAAASEPGWDSEGRGDKLRGDADAEEDWKEGWDGTEEKHLSWHFPSAAGASASRSLQGTTLRQSQQDPKQTRAERDPTQSGPLGQRRKSSRRKPTHFIGFLADSPAFITAAQHLRKEVTAVLPLSEPYWVPLRSLHVTLCLLVLSNPREVKLACEMLEEAARSRRVPPLSLSCSPELRDFGGRVLYLTPQPLSQIQALNSPLQELFNKRGWLHSDSLSPNYHLTLAKEGVNEGERGFKGVWEKVRNVASVRTIDFGTLAVDRLYLCAIGSPKCADGSYEKLCAVRLRGSQE